MGIANMLENLPSLTDIENVLHDLGVDVSASGSAGVHTDQNGTVNGHIHGAANEHLHTAQMDIHASEKADIEGSYQNLQNFEVKGDIESHFHALVHNDHKQDSENSGKTTPQPAEPDSKGILHDEHQHEQQPGAGQHTEHPALEHPATHPEHAGLNVPHHETQHDEGPGHAHDHPHAGAHQHEHHNGLHGHPAEPGHTDADHTSSIDPFAPAPEPAPTAPPADHHTGHHLAVATHHDNSFHLSDPFAGASHSSFSSWTHDSHTVGHSHEASHTSHGHDSSQGSHGGHSSHGHSDPGHM